MRRGGLLRVLPWMAIVAVACGGREPIVEQAVAPAAAPGSEDASEGSVSAPKQHHAPTLQRHVVSADDGHAIAVWSKEVREPRGVVILIHGRTWSARPDFDLQVPGKRRSLMDALAASDHTTYAVDLRGYGDTPRDDTGWLTPDRAAADVSAVIAFVRTRHPEHRPALLGWSLGSLVAQLVAQRQPDDLSALVLYGYPRDPDHRYARDPDRGPPPRIFTTAEQARADFISPDVVDDATIEAFVEAALATDPVRCNWRGSEQWSVLDPAAVRVPTLVIHGERDPLAPVSNQAKLFTRLGHPDRSWVIVAGGDHAAHLEDTGPRFTHAVVEFLTRPRPSSLRAAARGDTVAPR